MLNSWSCHHMLLSNLLLRVLELQQITGLKVTIGIICQKHVPQKMWPKKFKVHKNNLAMPFTQIKLQILPNSEKNILFFGQSAIQDNFAAIELRDMKTTVLSCHRCLINTGVEEMNI